MACAPPVPRAVGSPRRATYSCSSRRVSISARVAGATSSRPLSTFETVATDTPADAATVASVARPSLPGTMLLLCLVRRLAHSRADLDRGDEPPLVADHAHRAGQPQSSVAGQIRRRGPDEHVQI